MSKKDSLIHGVTTVGERGQIVIPLPIRTALKIKAGDEMAVFARDGKIVVLPAKRLEAYYESLIGRMDVLRKGLRK